MSSIENNEYSNINNNNDSNINSLNHISTENSNENIENKELEINTDKNIDYKEENSNYFLKYLVNSVFYNNRDDTKSEINSDNKESDINRYNEYMNNIKKVFNNDLFDKITVTDSNKKLTVFCYINCDENSDQSLKNTRGIIVDDKCNLILKTFPFTDEYLTTNNKLQEILSEEEFKKLEFYDSEEGTLLRLFYYEDKWYLSTHKKLDSYNSYWSSEESFGTIYDKSLLNEYLYNEEFARFIGEFDEEFSNYTEKENGTLIFTEELKERFYSLLDKKKSYLFLVRNNKDNRVVCSPPERNKLYYVGSFTLGTESLFSIEDIKITRPVKKYFENLEQVCKYVESIDHKKLQGVIVFSKDRHFKIVNSTYNKYFKVRGNEVNIKYRYVQLRNNPVLCESLKELYPEHISDFNIYENIIIDIAKYIHSLYIYKFIKKMDITPFLPSKPINFVIGKCHSWHFEDRNNNKVTLSKVLELVNNQPPNILNYMIKEQIKMCSYLYKIQYNKFDF